MYPMLLYLLRQHRNLITLFAVALVLLCLAFLALQIPRSKSQLQDEAQTPLTAEEKYQVLRSLGSSSPDMIDLTMKIETIGSLEKPQASISRDDKLMIMRSLDAD